MITRLRPALRAVPPRLPSSSVWPQACAYGALLALVCVLALSRLGTGPWYQTYNPFGSSLLEGWPTAWEVEYYLDLIPAFLGDAPPAYGMGLVHTRTFPHLYLTSVIYAWTGSAYWSFAAVDLGMWFLGGVAAYHVMRRLDAPALVAAAGTALVVSSPILISNMWRHDLHAANFSTMPIGLWAAVTLVNEVRGRVRLAASLGLLLFLLSVGYQYQWVLTPVIGVLLAFQPRFRWVERAAIFAGALLLYACGEATMRALLDVSGFGIERYADVVQKPAQLALNRFLSVRSLADLQQALPGVALVIETFNAYHPLVFGTGLIGLAFTSWRVRLMALAASAAALFSITLYPAPWTAMSAYPLIYLGAATACVGAGRAVLLGARRIAVGRGPLRGTRSSGDAVVIVVVSVALAVVLGALPNQDLVGRTEFMLHWFSYYAPGPIF
ncbi:MAG TPA: hypothetical protein VNM48_16840 [Chloroflexota bacterium]|nr:hypothetical protein [Chloroflexota bacterium]